MKDIVVAYSVIFLAIFIFSWLMFSRQSRLEKKVDDLKEELKESARSARR